MEASSTVATRSYTVAKLASLCASASRVSKTPGSPTLGPTATPADALSPNAVISAYSSVGVCDGATLDGGLSTGSGGRDGGRDGDGGRPQLPR